MSNALEKLEDLLGLTPGELLIDCKFDLAYMGKQYFGAGHFIVKTVNETHIAAVRLNSPNFYSFNKDQMAQNLGEKILESDYRTKKLLEAWVYGKNFTP